ncbi:MAG: hypothetical protein U0271_22220 [Polyangiaceae bacterium]
MKRARVAGVVASVACLFSGCFLPSFEKTTEQTPVCESATFEAIGGPTSGPNDVTDLFFAVRTYDFGESDLANRPGFDLDRICTCCDGCEETPACKTPAGGDELVCDAVDDVANAGRDNNFAKLLSDLDSATRERIVSSAALGLAASSGSSTLLVRVSNYNGQPDDDSVRLAIYTSDGTNGIAPTWSGTDLWSVRADSINATIDEPVFVVDNAYVSKGTLVGVFGAGSGSLALITPNGFTIRFGYAILQAQLESSNGGFRLADGVIGGMWPVSAIFPALSEIAVNSVATFCSDDPVYTNTLKPLLCSLPDSIATAAPAVVCDAISVGLAFTAEPILTPITIAPKPADAPACAADPATDSCGGS